MAAYSAWFCYAAPRDRLENRKPAIKKKYQFPFLFFLRFVRQALPDLLSSELPSAEMPKCSWFHNSGGEGMRVFPLKVIGRVSLMAASWVTHRQSQHMTILALLLRNTEVLVGLSSVLLSAACWIRGLIIHYGTLILVSLLVRVQMPCGCLLISQGVTRTLRTTNLSCWSLYASLKMSSESCNSLMLLALICLEFLLEILSTGQNRICLGHNFLLKKARFKCITELYFFS